MKPVQPTKRPRGHRGNGRRPNGGRNSNFESSGPQGKIRGTAFQVIEKYQAMGRDALTFGDRVAAENYFQHAEHYYRVMVASGGLEQRSVRPQGQPQNRHPEQESEFQAPQPVGAEGADQEELSDGERTGAADEQEQHLSGEKNDLNNSESDAPVA